MIIESKASIPSVLLRSVGRSLQGKLSTPLIRVANGELSVEQAGSRAFAALLESHANARYAGRLAAGDKSPINDADRESARLLAEEQQQYFKRFATQLADGKYRSDDGELNEAEIEDRAGLYSLRLRGSANDSWANALDSEDLVSWVLGGTENNCSICPDLAEQGPYKANELPTTPGANETPCMFNCRCELVSESGSSPPKNFAYHLKFSPSFLRKHGALCACHNKPLVPLS